MMDMPLAWDISTGNNVYVGIIDLGIDGTHIDRVDNVRISRSRSITDTLTDPLNDQGYHGTHVAGIIGALGNNGIGVAGICWEVQLVSLRVQNADGTIQSSNIIDAIEYGLIIDELYQ